MKKISVPVFLTFYALLFMQCRQASIPTPEEIAVTWQVVSNTYADQPQVKAVFTFENRSNFTLTANNWALYYNQMPRGVIATHGDARIEHLSGDWFKMTPTENFRLKPGHKGEITYECDAWWIKETDAPLGAYFVFYGNERQDSTIVPVKKYTILPFTTPEQVSRYKNDQEPIPTAGGRYEQNRNLTEVPDSELPAVIPSPFSVKTSSEKIVFDNVPELLYESGLENEARYLSGFISQALKVQITPVNATAPKANSIFLALKPLYINGKSTEVYRLEIKPDRSIVITGSDPAGVFYGIQSLIALQPAEVFRNSDTPATLPVMVMEDAPRFGFRGLHLDVARNFQSKETVKKIIDLMAFYKVNYLLFYLSEDEGWRLAIEELPELAQVAGQRGHTSKEAPALHPSYGSGPFPNDSASWGSGYYTREEFKEILQYALQRHVNIIPTINFPGHSRAAIKAMEARYQHFMKAGDTEKAEEFRLIDPEDQSKYLSAQAYTDNVVCVARESVYKFYETVIDDIIEMYAEANVPLEFFHTGGDEVPEGAWAGSPLCRKLMESLPEIGDPKNLQSYFFKRAADILNRKNLKIGGWEEVALLKNAEGKYLPNPEFAGKKIYPWVWNNQGSSADLAYRLANAGYPVVLCNVSNFYFDLAYDKDPQEPGLYWAGFVNTRNAWEFAPFNAFFTTTKTTMGRPVDPAEYEGMERLKPGAEKNIIGLEAHLWSETIKGPQMLEYYLLPKLIGFAESAWSKARGWETQSDAEIRRQQADQQWNIFANALAKRELPRLSVLFGGFNYRLPLPGAIVEEGLLKANVEYPGLHIRFTTNGEEPTNRSPLYNEPVKVSGEVRLKTFDAAGKSSRTVIVK